MTAVAAVAVAAAARHTAARDLVIPLLVLNGPGLVFFPLLLWTRRAPWGSKAYVVRLMVTGFAWAEAYGLAGVFGAIRLGVVSRAEGLHSVLRFLRIASAVSMALGIPLTYAIMNPSRVTRRGRPTRYPWP